MNRKLVLSLLCAILAGGLHYFYTRNLHHQITGGSKVSVVVTTRNIKCGEVLLEKDLAVRKVPIGYVDGRTVRSEQKDQIVGLPLAVAVQSGQSVQWSDLQRREGDVEDDLANYVESGMRAMTIVVNNELSMGGLLKPGHRVDILGTFLEGGIGGESARTKVLLQNIIVLATGKQLASDDLQSRYNTVTLSVGIEQSELVAFASELGTLSLVLRGYEDLVVLNGVPPKTHGDIFSAASTKPVSLEANKLKTGSFSQIERLHESR